MSHLDQKLWQDEVVVTSTDLNQSQQASSLTIQEMLKLLFGSGQQASISPADGVIGGFDLTVTGADISVILGPGIGMQQEGAGDSYSSDYRVLQLKTSLVKALDPADPTLNRIDAIVLKHAVKQTETTVKLYYNNVTSQFENRNEARREEPYIDDTSAMIVTGVPASSPTIPPTPSGYFAVWYVYRPAGSATILEAYLIDARQYLTARPLNSIISTIRPEDSPVFFQALADTQLLIMSGYVLIDGKLISISAGAVSFPSILETSEAANTWYHLYLACPLKTAKTGGNQGWRFVASTTLPTGSGKPSNSISAPVFNSGAFTLYESVAAHRCFYLGSVYNDALSNLRSMFQNGNRVVWDSVEQIGFYSENQATTIVDLKAYIPPGTQVIDIAMMALNNEPATSASASLHTVGDAAIKRLAMDDIERNSQSFLRGLVLTDLDRRLELSVTFDVDVRLSAYGYLDLWL